MALTEHVKSRAVNVTTGDATAVYYDEVEWAELQAAKAAAALPAAKTRRSAEIVEQAQTAVDSLIKPPALTQAMVRMNELLMVRILSGSWTGIQQSEVDQYQALLNTTRSLRTREQMALVAIAAASEVADVESVVL